MFPLALALILADAPKPKFTVGRDTTFVDGPIDKDGWIDFEAALNDRLSKGITPATNANALLWTAIGPTPEGTPMHPDYWKRLGVPAPPADGVYFVDDAQFAKARGKEPDDDLFNRTRELTRRPWAAADQPDHAAWLERNEKPMAVAAEAVKRPAYYNPPVSRDKDGQPGPLLGARLPNVQRCRGLAAALCGRAMLRTNGGQFDAAWADLQTVRRLARHVARGGTLIELLVGIAIDGIAFDATTAHLAARRPTAAQAAALARDLDALPPFPTPADTIDQAERFNFLDAVQLARRGKLDDLRGGAGREPDPALQKKLETLNWDTVFKVGNKWFDRSKAVAAAATRGERAAGWAKIEDDLRTQREEAREKMNLLLVTAVLGGDVRETVSEAVGQIQVGLLLPAVGKVSDAHDRVGQYARLTRLALALAAHRADTGAYPEALAALAPKYLKEIEPDVFGGRPLVYRRAGDGYLLYSVGPNEKDDDGRAWSDDPKGDDLVVRVP